MLLPMILLNAQAVFQCLSCRAFQYLLSGILFLNMTIFSNAFFLATVLKEGWPGLNSAANLHHSLSFLPPGGRSIFQLLPIPQTGKSF